ncbi:MAG: energy transducer TonB [Bacteroidota bacterium]
MKRFLITRVISILLIVCCTRVSKAQDDYGLFTYTLYHNVSGPKVYVTGFDSAASYRPDYNAFLLFMHTHVIPPLDVEGNHLKGKVYISFIVEKDGAVTDLKVIRSLSEACDNEVLRVMALLPNTWQPAMRKGKPVRSQFTLPFIFN